MVLETIWDWMCDSMKHYYFIVEGPHDVAMIGRVLKLLGVKEIRSLNDISNLWKQLIPNKYPFSENKLDRVSPIPSFYQNENVSVAIKSAGGDSKLISELDLTISAFAREDLKQIEGILVFCDADESTQEERFSHFIKVIKESRDLSFNESCFENKIGMFNGVNIKADIYMFPNNESKGTLEDLLLQGASVVYKDLLVSANEYVTNVDTKYKNRWSISSEKKVLMGCMTNILKPGKANQVSISDDKWVSEATITGSEDIKKLYNFINEFIL
ncbi:hypothetical protein G9F71_016300 [Clostridium sp. FP2]|uniref:DUF3226 domain-containing protein n=1 Tax=Clostridium sp. FP2 TaxID=2724481 RepID=UPI0013E94743|nr:DUF3226 domain-containing protein [Clostridium sp. FP2]MBZ9624413.1 hypothetical protein [Clostridium sp. FP2]